MAKPARFTPKQTPYGWRINIPPKFSESGKRNRFHYPSKNAALDAAKKFRDQRESFGNQAKAIAPHLADQAHAAAKLLEPLGIGLLEAVSRFVEAETSRRASVPVEEATARFETHCENKSRKYTQSIRHVAQHLVEDFAGRLLSTITAEEIAKHVADRTSGDAAYNSKLRILITFWKYAAKPPRNWCKPDALAHVEKRDAVSGEIGVLTATEARTLMKAAEEHYPDCVPGFAIALFTGMRQEELIRLDPEDITSEGITVPALSAKTKKRRFIHIAEPLASWLAAYPIQATVLPSNWKRKEQAVRREAGWRVWCNLYEPARAPEELPEWPSNALRHTAASVALASGKKIETLVFEHGHTGGLDTLQRHYIGKMPKQEAMQIVRMGPHGTELPDPNAEPSTPPRKARKKAKPSPNTSDRNSA